MRHKVLLGLLLVILAAAAALPAAPMPASAYYESEKYTTQPWPAINCRHDGCGSIGFGATRYFSLIGCMKEMTTEEWAQTKMYSPRTFDNATVYVLTNTLNGAATLTSRVNGDDGNITITIDAGETGMFQDVTNGDSLVDGDYFDWQLACGGSSGAIVLSFISCDATGKYLLEATWEPAVSPAESAAFDVNKIFAFGGAVASNTQGLADTDWTTLEYVFGGEAALTNMRVYVSANTLDAECSVSTEKNHVAPTWTAGDLSVAVAAGATGEFENTSSTQAYSSGDKGLWLIKTQGSSAGAVTVMHCQADLEYDGTMHVAAYGHGSFLGSVQTRYCGIDGSAYRNTGEASVRVPINQPCTARRLSLGLQNGNAAGTYTLTLRVNGAPSALVVSTSTTGYGMYINTDNTVVLAPTDQVDLELKTAGTVSGSFYLGAVELIPFLDPDPEPPPAPAAAPLFDVTPWVAGIVLFLLLAIPGAMMTTAGIKTDDASRGVLWLGYFLFVLVALMVILFPYLTR